jgi:hypothetical protein
MRPNDPDMPEARRAELTAYLMARWPVTLKARRAIPGIMVGVITAGRHRPQAVLVTELSREMTIDVLRKILDGLEAGKVEEIDDDPERN